MSIWNFLIIEASDGFDTDQQVDVGENDVCSKKNTTEQMKYIE